MLLRIIPPSGCVIPASLQTHAIPTPPSFPKGLKQPAAWTRTRTTFNNHGIALPTHQCVDRASWLSLAVEQVTWNLEDDVLIVAFVDGSEERWPIAVATPPHSTRVSTLPLKVHSTDSEHSDPMHQAQQTQDKLNDEPAVTTQTPGGDELKARESRDQDRTPLSSSSSWGSWRSSSPPSSSTVHTTCPLTDPSTTHHLRELCDELSTAYEEFVVFGIHYLTDDDLEHIVTMAGDPTIAPLPQWEPDASIGDPSDSLSSSSSLRGDDDRDGEIARDPTPPTAMMRFLGIFKPRWPSTWQEEESPGLHREHLRSAWGEVVRKLESVANAANAAVGVHVPLLAILKNIRTTMLDLFSRVITPAIKDRLNAPTYVMWATSNAAKACRARAIARAGEVAQHILALLDDDGETFDADSEDSSESESDAENHAGPRLLEIIDQLAEEEWDGIDNAFEPGRHERRAALKDKCIHERLSKNVMRECFEDFELRLWCEQTIGRGQVMEDSGDASEGWGTPQGVPHPRASATSVGPWTWARKIPSWEITRPITSDTDISKVTLRRRNVIAGPHAKVATDKNNPNETENPSTSPPATELSENEGHEASPKRKAPAPSTVIALEDPLDEGLLPPRIPQALVTNARDAYLGKDMIAMRRKTHQSLNQVAGLIRKVKELRDYLDDQTTVWDKQRMKEKALKTLPDNEHSCLRNPATSGSTIVEHVLSPPSKRLVPPKAQPLIQRAADRSVSRQVRNELNRRQRSRVIQKNPSPKQGQQADGLASKHPNTPRKRQRENLDIIDLIDHAKSPSPARKRTKQAPSPQSPDQVSDENVGTSDSGLKSECASTRQASNEPNTADDSRSTLSSVLALPWATTGTSAQLRRPPLSHFGSVGDHRVSGNETTSSKSAGPEQSDTPAKRFSIQELLRFRPHPVKPSAQNESHEIESSIEDLPTVRRGPHSWDPRYTYGEDGDEDTRLLNDGENDEEVIELRLPRLSDVEDESESAETGSRIQDEKHIMSDGGLLSRGLEEQDLLSQWVPPRPRSTSPCAPWQGGANPQPTRGGDDFSGPDVVEQNTTEDRSPVTLDVTSLRTTSTKALLQHREDDESSEIDFAVESPEAPAWIHSLRAPLVDTTCRSERSVPPSAEDSRAAIPHLEPVDLEEEEEPTQPTSSTTRALTTPNAFYEIVQAVNPLHAHEEAKGGEGTRGPASSTISHDSNEDAQQQCGVVMGKKPGV
ncbi:BQ2448_6481 [Microbotryum intermedium]|uniref:BQ2448_6481 protein n=1 Tax=Microbotryum intermedium TaxID=269621 RepID=A0A238FMM9_9BASI|nr:BQ2448_6481 [Microbotryum intermedium]